MEKSRKVLLEMKEKYSQSRHADNRQQIALSE